MVRSSMMRPGSAIAFLLSVVVATLPRSTWCIQSARPEEARPWDWVNLIGAVNPAGEQRIGAAGMEEESGAEVPGNSGLTSLRAWLDSRAWNPIRREVVTLIQTMQKKVKEAGEKDKDHSEKDRPEEIDPYSDYSADSTNPESVDFVAANQTVLSLRDGSSQQIITSGDGEPVSVSDSFTQITQPGIVAVRLEKMSPAPYRSVFQFGSSSVTSTLLILVLVVLGALVMFGVALYVLARPEFGTSSRQISPSLKQAVVKFDDLRPLKPMQFLKPSQAGESGLFSGRSGLFGSGSSGVAFPSLGPPSTSYAVSHIRDPRYSGTTGP